MVLSAQQLTKLLVAIEADALVLLCGAGLSIPEPSKLISAATVAERCYDVWKAVEVDLPAELRSDIDKLAAYFYETNAFDNVFIEKLVPWGDLVGTPNDGHAAVADLLLTGSAHAALSGNFDPLIENWAEQHKVALQGALTGQEAVEFLAVSKPLLKFHGCFHRDKKRTLWTHPQLEDVTIQQRVQSCSQWMNLNLPGKDLLIIGFWTDWGYLNDVLANSLEHKNAHSVTVIDPATSETLTEKAPLLWARLNALSHSFEHIPVSGADALKELRTAFSKVWARRYYALAAPILLAAGHQPPANCDTEAMSCSELYDFRRDAEGVSQVRAARLKAPQQGAAQAAYFRLRLLNAGAAKNGAWLDFNGQSVRIINGGGRALSELQSTFDEPSSYLQPSIAACIGALNLGVHPRIIQEGRGDSIVRPAKGGSARWLSLNEAEAELGL
jgi:hypothetical protein